MVPTTAEPNVVGRNFLHAPSQSVTAAVHTITRKTERTTLFNASTKWKLSSYTLFVTHNSTSFTRSGSKAGTPLLSFPLEMHATFRVDCAPPTPCTSRRAPCRLLCKNSGKVQASCSCFGTAALLLFAPLTISSACDVAPPVAGRRFPTQP